MNKNLSRQFIQLYPGTMFLILLILDPTPALVGIGTLRNLEDSVFGSMIYFSMPCYGGCLTNRKP